MPEPRLILLNPGPVTLSDRVRRALSRPDQCHREPEFAELTQALKQRIARVYEGCETDYEAILLTGSGTCAVEAMLASFAPRDSGTLVVANGVYGERMAEMLRRQGKPMSLVASDWMHGMDLEAVERQLAGNAELTHVAAVHNETTTGRLNDVALLARICRERGRSLLLDAVSSFGGEEIDFLVWRPLAVAATANKCLHGAPGACFVVAEKSAFERLSTQAASVYLDLFDYQREQRAGWSPFTSAVHVFFALDEALRELDSEGGWKARHARYAEQSRAVTEALAGCGVEPLLAMEERSSMVNAFRLPPGLSFADLHGSMRREGFVVYAGQGHLRESIFRIATMGDIQPEDLERLVAALFSIFGRRS